MNLREIRCIRGVELSFNLHAINSLIFENGAKCQEKCVYQSNIKIPFLINLTPAMENPRRHIPVPDDVFLAQVPAVGFIRRPVNEPELFGAVQGANLLDLTVGFDQPSFSGKIKIKTNLLFGGQGDDVNV